MRPLYFIDLSLFDNDFENNEKGIMFPETIGRKIDCLQWHGICVDLERQRMCCLNKTKLIRCFGWLKEEAIATAKELGLYDRGKAIIDRLFNDPKIKTWED